jgi:assimilatory nitrate reductase catalytic subunit
VSKVNRAVNPPGEARTDFDIFLDLARKLGCYEELFPGWTRPKDAFDEWKQVSAHRLCDYSGLTYELIERHGGIQWPVDRALWVYGHFFKFKSRTTSTTKSPEIHSSALVISGSRSSKQWGLLPE